MTARTGTRVTMVTGVTPEDLESAQKLVSTSPGYLSKWTKSELISAAIALRLFVRELPGGPKLLRRAMELARSTNGDEDEPIRVACPDLTLCYHILTSSLGLVIGIKPHPKLLVKM